MKVLYLLHVLATVVWVGGMFFAHQCLRPVVLAQLEPPQRLMLWNGVFGRFFPWVWASVLALLASGQAIIGEMGGMAQLPVHIHVMVGIGYVMAAIFAFIWFMPYRALRAAVAAQDWPAAGKAQDRIRKLVMTNLGLGMANIVVVFVLPLFL